MKKVKCVQVEDHLHTNSLLLKVTQRTCKRHFNGYEIVYLVVSPVLTGFEQISFGYPKKLYRIVLGRVKADSLSHEPTNPLKCQSIYCRPIYIQLHSYFKINLSPAPSIGC